MHISNTPCVRTFYSRYDGRNTDAELGPDRRIPECGKVLHSSLSIVQKKLLEMKSQSDERDFFLIQQVRYFFGLNVVGGADTMIPVALNLSIGKE